ncbi:MAG: hypothetical protein AB7O21_04645 [Gammaproteobacteria bacterium]
MPEPEIPARAPRPRRRKRRPPRLTRDADAPVLGCDGLQQLPPAERNDVPDAARDGPGHMLPMES